MSGRTVSVNGCSKAWLTVLVAFAVGCGETTGASGPQIVGVNDAGEDAVVAEDTATDAVIPPADVSGDVASTDVAGTDAAATDAIPGDDTPGVDADSTLGTDAIADTGDDTLDVAPDAATDAGVDAAVEVSACTAADCACGKDSDCDSGACLDGAPGKTCAATCTGNCAPGFACVTGGVGKICKPAFPRLCEPCQKDSDCAETAASTGTCVAYTAGGALLGNFCGGGKCDASVQCPGGYTCSTVISVDGYATPQCIRDDKTCPCDTRAEALGLTTSCTTANASGTCGGKRSCTSNGLSACSAPAAGLEICDGADNDCDGVTDNISCDDKNGCTADACDPTQKA